MTTLDSALDPVAVARARALLAKPLARERSWPVLTAAAALALSALAFAGAMITAPPVVTEHVARGAPG